jgi:hypothetical protein
MRTAISVVLLFTCLPGISQNDSVQKNYAITFHSGKTVVHSQSVKNIEGAKPFGVEIELSKQQTGFSSFNISNAYVKTGWALSYFDYDLPLLGYGIMASRFIEPQYRIAKKIQLGVRGSVGVAYLSNPNDASTNPRNSNYSLHINPYFQLGSSLNIQVSNHFTAGLQSSFHHISNGNLKQPNQGINWMTASLGLHYYPGNNELPVYKRNHDKFWKNKKATTQVGVFYVPQQGYLARWMAQRKYLIGAYAQITKQVGGVSGLTAGAEVYYNNFKQDAVAKPIASRMVAGVHAGHVFLFGKVNFSQQIGYSIYNKIYFLPGFYHRWGLEYVINKRYTIGGSLKANSDNADFFDLRVGAKF